MIVPCFWKVLRSAMTTFLLLQYCMKRKLVGVVEAAAAAQGVPCRRSNVLPPAAFVVRQRQLLDRNNYSRQSSITIAATNKPLLFSGMSRRAPGYHIHSNNSWIRTTTDYSRQQQQQQNIYFSTLSEIEDKNTIPTKQEEKEDLDQIYQELQWLSTEIRRHDALYYNQNTNDINDEQEAVMMITDDDYDALVRREEEICKAYPQLQNKWEQESGLGKLATRFGGRVGIDVDATPSAATWSSDSVATSSTGTRFQKRKHLSPMLSLDNVTSNQQLLAWLERLRKKWIASLSLLVEKKTIYEPIVIVTEPKLDGLSLSLRYKLQQTGKHRIPSFYELIWACTRGDGKQGQDVTRPVQEGMKLSKALNLSKEQLEDDISLLPPIIEIRGEVVMPNSVFAELQQESIRQQAGHNNSSNANDNLTTTSATIPSFSNPRNAASGILLRKYEAEDDKDQTTTKLQSKLQFYAYDMVEDNRNTRQDWAEDYLENRQKLQDWGFQVPTPMALTTLSLSSTQGNVVSSSIGDDEDGAKNMTVLDFEEWVDKDIEPMLEYYKALGEHRKIEQQDGHGKTAEPKKQTNSAVTNSADFQWGDYDMDGCVHKVVQASFRRLLGSSTRAPRWAVAHKFPSQSAITSLLNIEVQVGRKSGALTPVAILEPVELAGGVTVTRATLHNFQHMQQILLYGSKAGQEKDSAAINETSSSTSESSGREEPHPFLAKGTKVLVRRAGDVIPQVVQLAEPPKARVSLAPEEVEKLSSENSTWIDLSPPLRCPACGSPAVVDALTSRSKKSKNSTDDNNQTSTAKDTSGSMGQVLRCGGPPLLCPPRAVGALAHAYSRDALDISGLSESKIQQLMTMDNNNQSQQVDEGEVNVTNRSLPRLRFPSDIFQIAKDPAALEAIANLPGWGPKSASNIARAANKVASEGVSLARFIFSLSIRFAGVHSSKLIANAYGTVDAFLESIEEASQMNLTAKSEAQVRESELQQPFAIIANKENEATKGIGPALLSSLIAFSKEKELVQAAKDLANAIRVLEDEDFQQGKNAGELDGLDQAEDPIRKPLLGMKVVFTGSLTNLNLTRKEAQALAKSMGAKATPSTISKATDLVVVGEKGGGKKLNNAKDLGVKIMEADEFLALVKKFQN